MQVSNNFFYYFFNVTFYKFREGAERFGLRKNIFIVTINNLFKPLRYSGYFAPIRKCLKSQSCESRTLSWRKIFKLRRNPTCFNQFTVLNNYKKLQKIKKIIVLYSDIKFIYLHIYLLFTRNPFLIILSLDISEQDVISNFENLV